MAVERRTDRTLTGYDATRGVVREKEDGKNIFASNKRHSGSRGHVIKGEYDNLRRYGPINFARGLTRTF